MEQIIAYRRALDMAQQALAEKLQTSPGYLHDIETGRRKPSPALARRIEELTGISRHDLRPDVFGPAKQDGVQAA